MTMTRCDYGLPGCVLRLEALAEPSETGLLGLQPVALEPWGRKWLS